MLNIDHTKYQLDALNIIYSSNILLYMFRVSSTHLQEEQLYVSSIWYRHYVCWLEEYVLRQFLAGFNINPALYCSEPLGFLLKMPLLPYAMSGMQIGLLAKNLNDSFINFSFIQCRNKFIILILFLHKFNKFSL